MKIKNGFEMDCTTTPKTKIRKIRVRVARVVQTDFDCL